MMLPCLYFDATLVLRLETCAMMLSCLYFDVTLAMRLEICCCDFYFILSHFLLSTC
jgi:hypothetical protein